MSWKQSNEKKFVHTLAISVEDLLTPSPTHTGPSFRVAILAVLILIILILFEVYKSDFERWVTPLRDWLKEREAWSWVIPLAILLGKFPFPQSATKISFLKDLPNLNDFDQFQRHSAFISTIIWA